MWLGQLDLPDKPDDAPPEADAMPGVGELAGADALP